MRAEHAVRVPPASPVHLAVASDNKSEAKESVEVDYRSDLV
jgi:hypothetical protein